MVRRLITTADDFGLTPSINEAVELAARHGILTSASLMVAGEAAADAVRRAKATPKLAVGLHLVVIEGPATLPPAEISELVDSHGQFGTQALKLGLRYYFSPSARRKLAREIRAQFQAFHRTGLTLDHANAHKHMHLHPTIGRLMIEIGREYGLRAIRVPYDPTGTGVAALALRQWCAVLRGQAHRANLLTNDFITGLADTGHMTPRTVLKLLAGLPHGLSEMYFHPATSRNALLAGLMPSYEHAAEFLSLTELPVPADVLLTRYGALS